MLAYLAIFFTSLAGLFGAPVWAIGLAAISLTSLSYAEHHLLYRRISDFGLNELADTTIVGSVLNALAATSIAYIAGWAFRFLGLPG